MITMVYVFASCFELVCVLCAAVLASRMPNHIPQYMLPLVAFIRLLDCSVYGYEHSR